MLLWKLLALILSSVSSLSSLIVSGSISRILPYRLISCSRSQNAISGGRDLTLVSLAFRYSRSTRLPEKQKQTATMKLMKCSIASGIVSFKLSVLSFVE